MNTVEVWRELHDPLLGFVARRVSSVEDAEDIVQEVMLRIHLHSADLAHVEQVAAWVYRITSNAIIDHYRRPARRERPAGADLGVRVPDAASWAPGATDEDIRARAELAGCLRPMVGLLSPKYREAIMLTELGGITQSAAADLLGLSRSGMKTRVQRARRQLKDLLLECCRVDLDVRGEVTGFHSRDAICRHCTGAADPPAT